MALVQEIRPMERGQIVMHTEKELLQKTTNKVIKNSMTETPKGCALPNRLVAKV